MPVLINLIDSSDESDEDEVPAAAQQPPPPAVAQQPSPPAVAQQPSPPAAAQQPSPPAAAQQPAPPAAAPQPVPPAAARAAAQAPQLAGPSSARTQPSQGAAASSISRMESAGSMRLVAASARPDAEGHGAAGQHGRRDEPGGGGREARLGKDARRPVADAILFVPKLPHSVGRDALRRLFSAFGTVVDVSRSHQSGTVCFQTGAEAKRALAAVSAPEYAPQWSPPLPAGELSRLRVEFALIDKLPKGMRGKASGLPAAAAAAAAGEGGSEGFGDAGGGGERSTGAHAEHSLTYSSAPILRQASRASTPLLMSHVIRPPHVLLGGVYAEYVQPGAKAEQDMADLNLFRVERGAAGEALAP
eukprot:CAMPEP_0185497228 /NCGR_PEP_ID=MMETSP1366-20130426/18822_1 /TAXON_ID=38817 /ORGANISM="Gephyrocapsa oceanica, Strain RCC1303" /LENGTH=359 /DNA_ID=CAMNT_0028106327 /DNA_START=42 /DNA_END=1118 /DNA_ORIENTATION=-